MIVAARAAKFARAEGKRVRARNPAIRFPHLRFLRRRTVYENIGTSGSPRLSPRREASTGLRRSHSTGGRLELACAATCMKAPAKPLWHRAHRGRVLAVLQKVASWSVQAVTQLGRAREQIVDESRALLVRGAGFGGGMRSLHPAPAAWRSLSRKPARADERGVVAAGEGGRGQRAESLAKIGGVEKRILLRPQNRRRSRRCRAAW